MTSSIWYSPLSVEGRTTCVTEELTTVVYTTSPSSSLINSTYSGWSATNVSVLSSIYTTGGRMGVLGVELPIGLFGTYRVIKSTQVVARMNTHINKKRVSRVNFLIISCFDYTYNLRCSKITKRTNSMQEFGQMKFYYFFTRRNKLSTKWLQRQYQTRNQEKS